MWRTFLTFGAEGAPRSGFFRYELDFIFLTLKVLSWLGITWDLKPVPEAVKRAASWFRARHGYWTTLADGVIH